MTTLLVAGPCARTQRARFEIVSQTAEIGRFLEPYPQTGVGESICRYSSSMKDRFQHLPYVYGLRFVDPLSRDAADDAVMIVSDNENIRRIIREAETAEHFLSDSRYWTVPGFRQGLIYGRPVRNDARLSLTDGGTRFV